MGSTGSGSFGNYKPSKSDRCKEELETELEEVANTDYYKKHKALPKVGSSVRLLDKTVGGRLVVLEVASGMNLGLLPTSLNFLRICTGKGFKYEGNILAVKSTKVPKVRISLEPL